MKSVCQGWAFSFVSQEASHLAQPSEGANPGGPCVLRSYCVLGPWQASLWPWGINGIVRYLVLRAQLGVFAFC